MHVGTLDAWMRRGLSSIISSSVSLRLLFSPWRSRRCATCEVKTASLRTQRAGGGPTGPGSVRDDNEDANGERELFRWSPLRQQALCALFPLLCSASAPFADRGLDNGWAEQAEDKVDASAVLAYRGRCHTSTPHARHPAMLFSVASLARGWAAANANGIGQVDPVDGDSSVAVQSVAAAAATPVTDRDTPSWTVHRMATVSRGSRQVAVQAGVVAENECHVRRPHVFFQAGLVVLPASDAHRRSPTASGSNEATGYTP